jgi:diaminopimelate epimerase
MELRVTKMHGALNDFVVIDARTMPVPPLDGAAARLLCDRRRGIGADGVLVLRPGEGDADVRMEILNADGSRAQTCGNGLRCVAAFLHHDGAQPRLRIATDAGVAEAQVLSGGVETMVRVTMERPRFIACALPYPNARMVEAGNEHLIVFVDDVGATDLPGIASACARAAGRPDGINVHVATIAEGELHLRHHERGVGETPACGSGAVAAAACAIAGRVLSSPVRVRVPGGTLTVEWDGSGPPALTGPAVRVFDARITLPVGVRAAS